AGDWIDVPTVPDAFIVNGGQLLLRWTNDYFLATPHRAVSRTGSERYALAFFLRCSDRLADRRGPDLRQPWTAAPIRDDLLYRLHGPVSGENLQRIRRLGRSHGAVTVLDRSRRSDALWHALATFDDDPSVAPTR